MKRLLLSLPLLLSITGAYAQDSGCSSIKSDKQRLACYDKADRSAKAAAPTVVAATAPVAVPEAKESPGKPKQFRSHSWYVDESVDSMTDKKTCTALYKNQWTVQGVANNLYISMKGRGGISAYTIRLDDNPPDEMQLASDMEKQVGAVILGQKFARAYSSKRLRVQVLTLISGMLVEDIDLDGFKDAVDYIRSNCQA